MNAATAQRDDWRTPLPLFERLNSEFHFNVDGAADATNFLLTRYLTAEDNALAIPWTGMRMFVNPPFSLKAAFAEKAARREAEVCVMILPATVSQRWFHNFVMGSANYLYVPQGRIKFAPPPGVEKSGPRFDSVIAVWDRVERNIGVTTELREFGRP